jgi:hypothetical protein
VQRSCSLPGVARISTKGEALEKEIRARDANTNVCCMLSCKVGIECSAVEIGHW